YYPRFSAYCVLPSLLHDALPILLDASVDAAVCGLALVHLPDLRPAFAELARVVRPGGRIVVSGVHPFLVALGWQAQFTAADGGRSEEHTSELQSRENLVCRLLLE